MKTYAVKSAVQCDLKDYAPGTTITIGSEIAGPLLACGAIAEIEEPSVVDDGSSADDADVEDADGGAGDGDGEVADADEVAVDDAGAGAESCESDPEPVQPTSTRRRRRG
jgi:hypothetical protein